MRCWNAQVSKTKQAGHLGGEKGSSPQDLYIYIYLYYVLFDFRIYIYIYIYTFTLYIYTLYLYIHCIYIHMDSLYLQSLTWRFQGQKSDQGQEHQARPAMKTLYIYIYKKWETTIF